MMGSSPNPQNVANNQGAVANPNEPTQVSSFPPPPMQYIKMYSDENVRRGVVPGPPPPILDSYTMFGHVFTAEDCIVASLESQGIRRLYSAKDVDRKRELRKLNHSILVNFLDILDILIRAPDSPKREEKIDDLNLLFIHMHHLINEFRPHQARETLRVMLHVQKRKRLQVADKFQEHLDKVQETIQEALASLPDTDEDNKFMVPTDEEQSSKMETDVAARNGWDDQSNKDKSSCLNLDKLMCQLVDKISTE